MREFQIQPYQYFVPLNQMTPMIHFQHSQFGVTPRATEVKPKLDRYFIKLHGGAAALRQVHPNWIFTDSNALRYKMQFYTDANYKIESIPYKIYYANTGSKEMPSHMLLTGNCTMKLTCSDGALLEELKKCLNSFFISHSFGFMSGKGFGGYLPKGFSPTPQQIATALKTAYGCAHVYQTARIPAIQAQFFVEDGKRKSKPNVFDNMIKPFHMLMKSGINMDKYERSYLFQYFHKQPNCPFGNDKAFVKQTGIAPVVSTKRIGGEHKRPYPSYKYVRALLGVAGSMFYRSKPNVTISISSKEIERFASPVRYRIINNQLYIYTVPIPDQLYGSNFKFSSRYQNKSGVIPVPVKSEFNLEDFLQRYIGHVNESPPALTSAGFKANTKFREV